MAMHKGDSYSGSDAGVIPAAKRNPNVKHEVNGSPCGPYAHHLGYTDDGGMEGNTSVKGKRGGTYYFK